MSASLRAGRVGTLDKEAGSDHQGPESGRDAQCESELQTAEAEEKNQVC